MIRPALVARNGELVAPAYTDPRFVSIGGDVLDFAQRQARPTLAEAQLAFRAYQRLLAAETNPRLCKMLAREALALADAIKACCAHRRAAGYLNVNDADARRAG